MTMPCSALSTVAHAVVRWALLSAVASSAAASREEAVVLRRLRASLNVNHSSLPVDVQLFDDWEGPDPCLGNWTGVKCGGGDDAACGNRVTELDIGRGDSIWGVLPPTPHMAGLLTDLPPEIGRLGCLRALNLSGHNIGQLPVAVANLQRLETLDLFRNELSDGRQLHPVGKLVNLRHLRLSENHLLDLPSSFCKLQRLEKLELQHTNLRLLTFGEMRVGELLLDDAGRLSDVACLSSLQYLDVSSNNLVALPAQIGKLKKLTDLNLNNTDITHLPPTFVELSALHTLSLCFTGPVQLPVGFAHMLTRSTDTDFRCICPAGMYESWRGNIGCFETADVFHLGLESSSTGQVCAPCPSCLDCAVHGELTVQTGWALQTDQNGIPEAAFQCPDSDSCLGGAPSTTCASGTTGPLCTECEPQFSRLSADGSCVPCGEASANIDANRKLAVWVVVSGVLLLLLHKRAAAIHEYSAEVELLEHRGILMGCLATTACCGSCSGQLLETMERAQVLEHTKIVVGLFQVLAPMGDILLLPFKDRMPIVHHLFHLADVLFVDVEDYVQLDCLEFWQIMSAPTRFYVEWSLKVFMVPLTLLCVVLVYFACTRDAAASRNWGYLVLFLTYPHVSEEVFSMLSCRQLGQHESWITADMSTPCNDQTHEHFVILAVFMVVVVVIGLPVGFIHALRSETRLTRLAFQQSVSVFNDESSDLAEGPRPRARGKPRPKGAAALVGKRPLDFSEYNFERLQVKYAAMIGAFRPEFLYFEGIDWLRKVFLGGMLLLLQRGSIAQIFTAMAVSFAFFGLHGGLRPYRHTATNVLKGCVESAIFLALATGLLLRFEKHEESQVLQHDLLQTSEYEWLAVCGFVMLVPGAFIFCSFHCWTQSRSREFHVLRMRSFRSHARGANQLLLGYAKQQQEDAQKVSGLGQTLRQPSFVIDLEPVRMQSQHDARSSETMPSVVTGNPGMPPRCSVNSNASSTTLWARAQQERSYQQGLEIVRNSIAAAQARCETFADFKSAYRPVGVDGVLKDLWAEVEHDGGRSSSIMPAPLEFKHCEIDEVLA